MTTTIDTTNTTAISVTRGESKTFTLRVRDALKAAQSLTGAKIWFTVKHRLEDAAATISKKTANLTGGADTQILINPDQTSATTKGLATLFIAAADTANLDPSKSYVCDLWVELTDGTRTPLLKKRTFTVEAAVTTSFT